MAEYKRHHDKRMAGDVFEEGSKFRDGVERRYGSERYSDLAAPGMQEAHVGDSGTERYSGAEIRAEVREGGMDADYYRKLKADGAKFNGNALDFLYDEFGLNFQGGKKGNNKPAPVSQTPEVEDEPVNEVINDVTEDEQSFVTPPTMPGSGMNQYVTQDNDITTDITGDNNKVENTQDNTVEQYGGIEDGETYLADWMKGHKFFD